MDKLATRRDADIALIAVSRARLHVDFGVAFSFS